MQEDPDAEVMQKDPDAEEVDDAFPDVGAMEDLELDWTLNALPQDPDDEVDDVKARLTT